MELFFNNIREVKDFLKSRIFTIAHKETYIFEEDTYATFPGNICAFMQRRDVVWKNINPKHKYSILRDGADFFFITHKKENGHHERIYVISASDNLNDSYTVSLVSLENKMKVELISE